MVERILASLAIALACSVAQAANVNVLYLYTQAGQTAVGGPSSLSTVSGGQNAATNSMLLSAGTTGGAINVGNATITTCCIDAQTGLDYGNYVSTGGPAIALNMAQHNHEIAAFRDAAGADIVVVVTDDGGAGTDCGLTWNVPQVGPAREGRSEGFLAERAGFEPAGGV
jgi:hypothetical protein